MRNDGVKRALLVINKFLERRKPLGRYLEMKRIMKQIIFLQLCKC